MLGHHYFPLTIFMTCLYYFYPFLATSELITELILVLAMNHHLQTKTDTLFIICEPELCPEDVGELG